MKNVKEWLEQFNLLYDNVTSGQAPGLDEYEISVFLTQAQDQVVDGIYSGSLLTGGYEHDERAREILSVLNSSYVASGSIAEDGEEDDLEYYGYKKIHINIDSEENDKPYERIRYKTVEYFSYGGKTFQVIPIKKDDILRTLPNPFRGGNRFRVIKLDGDSSSQDNNVVDLYFKHVGPLEDSIKYTVHYIRNPKPIILYNVDEEEYSYDTINGYNEYPEINPCELPEEIHYTILSAAVTLAKNAWKS